MNWAEKKSSLLIHARTRVWWAIGGSNPGPTGYEPVALTNWANGPYRGIPKHGYYTTGIWICQVISKNNPSDFWFFKTFFEKGVAFFSVLWYTIMRLMVPLRFQTCFIRRCIEVVITVSTRNRVASKIARGFESHRLRQQKRNLCLPKVPFLFIQAAGLAYHHRTTCGAYHQPLWGCISPVAWWYTRLAPWFIWESVI